MNSKNIKTVQHFTEILNMKLVSCKFLTSCILRNKKIWNMFIQSEGDTFYKDLNAIILPALCL